MKLYYAKGSSSIAARIILEELGVQHTSSCVDLSKQENRTPEYLALNPMGMIPLLILDDGTILTENIAILSYLGEYKPESGLLPKPGTLERHKANEWLAFIGTELQKTITHIVRIKEFSNEEKCQKELIKNLKHKLYERILVTELRLDGLDYCVMQQFGVCDAYLFYIVNRMTVLKMETAEYSNLIRVIENVKKRPMVQKIMKQEGLL